jgi:hypothetical protein
MRCHTPGKVRFKIKTGSVVSERYRVSKKIGCGSFGTFKLLSLSNIFTQLFLHHYTGEIYSAYDIFSGEEVAIKVETHLSMFSQLRNEHKSYEVLGIRSGFPHIKWFGMDSDHTIMVLTLLGRLDHRWKGSGLLRSTSLSWRRLSVLQSKWCVSSVLY